VALVVATVVAVSTSPGSVSAQEELGDQRSGTSAGTFLKISVDPRGAALGNAATAYAPGITALAWNPAALTDVTDTEVMGSYIKWPGDIEYTYFAAARDARRVNGTIGVQFGYLGTVLEETTETQPYGTGRNFGVRDWYLALTYARQFTDRLSFGFTSRYVREELATEIGGPVADVVLFDLGTLYHLGQREMTLAFSLQHFGPEFQPSGTFVSNVTGADTDYASFSPPTVFRLATSGRVWRRGQQKLNLLVEMNHFSDAAETIKMGAEFSHHETFFLRGGYDATADAMKWSAGAGFHTRFGFNTGDFDYAFTDAGPLGEVHRLALRITL
jgi:hypothetical protein